MEKIEGRDLDTIIKKASNEWLEDKERCAIRTIKKLFYALAELQKEIKNLENRTKEKKKILLKKNKIMDRLKDGDWGALSEEEKDV